MAHSGVDRGVRKAATILDALPPSRRTHMTTETAKTVLRMVPVAQHERPAIREFREVLARTVPDRPALEPGA